MNLSNYFWSFSGVLTPKFCDDVIKYALSKEEVMARTGGYGDKKLNKEEVKNLYKKRRSDLVWLSEPWIYKELHPYVHMANKNAGWNFQLGLPDETQFTIYNKNQFYDWHSDSFPEPFKNGSIRKISSTLLLNDPLEFKGGEFWFSIEEDRKICEELNSKGSLVVFPSFIRHKIAPITKGTRYSMVTWNNGDPWK